MDFFEEQNQQNLLIFWCLAFIFVTKYKATYTTKNPTNNHPCGQITEKPSQEDINDLFGFWHCGGQCKIETSQPYSYWCPINTKVIWGEKGKVKQ